MLHGWSEMKDEPAVAPLGKTREVRHLAPVRVHAEGPRLLQADRAGREACEGLIVTAAKDNAIAVVELLSETDFAARNDSFVAAANKIVQIALAGDDGDVQADDQINQLIEDLRITIKENISFARGIKLSGERVGSYVHHDGKKGAVLVGTGDLDDELITGICQHITATIPPSPAALAVDLQGLPGDEVEKQKATFIEEAKAMGKPEEIADKIATGKMRKWVDDHTLLGQIYLRRADEKKPIRSFLPKGAGITRFVRCELGVS